MVWLCTYNFRNFALADKGISVAAETRIHKKLVHVFKAAHLFAYAVFAFAVAIVLSGDDDFVVIHKKASVAVVKTKTHFRKAVSMAQRGSVKNNVLHFGAAKRLCGLFAQNPANGVAYIAFSASVWADNGGHAAAEIKAGFIGK